MEYNVTPLSCCFVFGSSGCTKLCNSKPQFISCASVVGIIRCFIVLENKTGVDLNFTAAMEVG